ncbi:hypothetical protein SMSP2_00386 [Limihaloglobus sulfuriphilus]|uniref:Uncharacterized protein n=1 Tax=Limihaloglobus sulfuriphilus TaxID=1851148 RepID=A0A1Q2MBK9_9BACT|nr:hypothetical protein [Limihaloglobus sulfuriphilus]AQQ70049.1 hypothetical protein SMSP2_00386 [Limihaloglobus sulfuriphilus]
MVTKSMNIPRITVALMLISSMPLLALSITPFAAVTAIKASTGYECAGEVTAWYVAAGDRGGWDDGASWNLGGLVPCEQTTAGINTAGKGPLVSAGMAMSCMDLIVGQTDIATDSRLYVEGGGTLAIGRSVYLGRLNAAAVGTVTVDGADSVIDQSAGTNFVVGNQGTGNLIINDGTVKAKYLRVGLDGANADQGGSGYITVMDGVLEAFHIYMNENDPADAVIDLHEGTIVIDAYYYFGDVDRWMENGQFILYGGDPEATVNIEWMDWDGNDDGDMETVITASLNSTGPGYECAPAGTAWFIGPDRGEYTDPANWNQSGKVPCEETDAGVNVSDTAILVTTGMDVDCRDLNICQFDVTNAGLYVEGGGVLEVNRNAYVARLRNGGTGFINVTGEGSRLSQLNPASFAVGAWGDAGILIDQGGRIDAHWLRVGIDAANTDNGGSGSIIIRDGVLKTFLIYFNEDPSKGVIDLHEGTLIISAYDKRADVQSWFESGHLIAYGGNPLAKINAEWADWDNDGTSETVVTATLLDCPLDWSDYDFNGDCIVDWSDMETIIPEWTMQAGPKVVYDFDFSSDVIASGDFTYRSSGTSEYNFTDEAGMLHFTQPTIFDSVDAYYMVDDADIVFAAKADDEAGVALWQDFLMDTNQRFVSWIRVMKDASDPTKQVVEFLKGVPDWGVFATQGAQDAVYVYDFPADAVLTISAYYHVDQAANTVTLDWEVTDGTTTQSGSGVSFSPLASGGPSYHGITLYGPGTGYYDQLTYELSLVPMTDLTGDDSVDFADFSLIGSAWLDEYIAPEF